MNYFNFRITWNNKLVLQRLRTTRNGFGDPEYHWQDATTQDLKHYYALLKCSCEQTQQTKQDFLKDCI